MISDHVRALAAKAPSSASVADPEKSMVSPTVHSRSAEGVSIDGVGPVLLTVMVTASVSVAPWGSLTLTVAT